MHRPLILSIRREQALLGRLPSSSRKDRCGAAWFSTSANLTPKAPQRRQDPGRKEPLSASSPSAPKVPKFSAVRGSAADEPRGTASGEARLGGPQSRPRLASLARGRPVRRLGRALPRPAGEKICGFVATGPGSATRSQGKARGLRLRSNPVGMLLAKGSRPSHPRPGKPENKSGNELHRSRVMSQVSYPTAVRSNERAPQPSGPEATHDVNSTTGRPSEVSRKDAKDTPDTFVRLTRPQPVAREEAVTAFSLRAQRNRPEASNDSLSHEWPPSRAALQAMLKELDAPAPRPEAPQADPRPVQPALEKAPEAVPAPAAAPSKSQESPAQPLPAPPAGAVPAQPLPAPPAGAVPAQPLPVPPAGAVPALADVTSQDLSRPGVRDALAKTLRYESRGPCRRQ